MATENDVSILVEFFGNNPVIKIMDFLLENRLQDFPKTEIAKGAGLGIATVHLYWRRLEKAEIVTPTRKIGRIVLYQLNDKNPIVRAVKEIEIRLIENSAEEATSKVTIKARTRTH
ncbi:MAG: helix-turn-helix domain-containing protein [Candidatus Micrarchaeota archaeon]